MGALQNILWEAKKLFYDFDRYEIAGVTIIHHEASADEWDEWRPVLEEWLPQFEEAGWTEELKGIRVGSTFPTVSHGGTYRSGRQIIDLHISSNYIDNFVIDGTKEATLIHEMTHHVHIRENFHYPIRETTDEKLEESFGHINRDIDIMLETFGREVSDYAGVNILEAVAETATAITLGYDVPNHIVDAYKELNGPKTVENWAQAESTEYRDYINEINSYDNSKNKGGIEDMYYGSKDVTSSSNGSTYNEIRRID